MDVLPCLNIGQRDRTVGDRAHVVQHLWRGLEPVHHFTEHVFHDHLKGVLVSQRGREVDLPVNGDTPARCNAVGDGVNDLTAGVPDVHLNIKVFEECVGQDAVVDLHRVLHAVAVAVGKHRVVERQRGGGGDSSCFDVNGSFGVGWAARRVVAVGDRGGVPRDDPNLIGEVAKARNQTRGDVVDEIQVRNAPQTVGDGFGDDHTVKLAFVCGQSQREGCG